MVEALQALAGADGLIVADRRDLVTNLNSTIQDRRRSAPKRWSAARCRARRPDLRDRRADQHRTQRPRPRRRQPGHWIITGIDDNCTVHVTGRRGQRTLPPWNVATRRARLPDHGIRAQGQTVDAAHLLLTETTGAASAYVAMTRGRHRNTAHLVAGVVDAARQQWVQAFSRDRADLGPNHAAAKTAARDVERHGGVRPPRPEDLRRMQQAQNQSYGIGR